MKKRFYPWLVVPRERPDATQRLICFPYAGGSAVAYAPWAANLPPSIEVAAVELPGRGTRFGESFITAMPELIEQLHASLRLDDGPTFSFFGHSLGALIAFEFARLLQRTRSRMPRHLIVSGKRAPQAAPQPELVHKLADVEFRRRIVDYAGTPQSVLNDADLMQLLLPQFRADFELCECYEFMPGPQLECRLACFAGTADSETTGDLLAGWRIHARNCQTVLFPGGHFFIQTAQAQVLTTVLELLTGSEQSESGDAAMRAHSLLHGAS